MLWTFWVFLDAPLLELDSYMVFQEQNAVVGTPLARFLAVKGDPAKGSRYCLSFSFHFPKRGVWVYSSLREAALFPPLPFTVSKFVNGLAPAANQSRTGQYAVDRAAVAAGN
jgi:hypothetical protein